jgi:hypothetical protein
MKRLEGLKAWRRGTGRPEGLKAWRLGGLKREPSRLRQARLPAFRPSSLQAFFLMLIGATTRVLACPICFQVEEGPVTAGVRAAVVVLIGVTVGVLAGFGVFVGRFVVRSHAVRPGSEGADTVEKRPVPLCR